MIEKILGSPLRIRIILALWEMGEINATELAKRLETNYSQLISHIKLLASYGLVEERRIGRIRLVKLRNSELVKMLVNALKQADESIKRGKADVTYE
ncbi:transcriptional regulator, ArsR family [Pyrobaculum islandicum DSM 4184]|uniref:Transcriptional regulator, ArsR family n=1 Tax=Pyrobaculum islandicum (strain DSM 4184 / JCM 9189 / GEO3) TaxID=384616 RepID=A1RSA6_PYRIL|nr:winged helix-turn-helix domain-containing protein [Pyrobaculum islandicum]ABL87838.1 transcriptional regulator, ArsR family [Pyrobaculum islandicum DSM 4184]